MRPSCLLFTRFQRPIHRWVQRRNLLTLAIETSCDDTSVAVLQLNKKSNNAALLFHEKITSNNQSYGGVHPIVAHESHQKNLAILIDKALQSLPFHNPSKQSQQARHGFYLSKGGHEETLYRKKPNFITVTRGPGMRSNLITGLDTAKGLAVAWQIPLLGVNHMQAHALTPRLVSALDSLPGVNKSHFKPAFPFLTLLVSGGHTMLVHSKGLCDHEILADMTDIAVGDMIDKCARDVLPEQVLRDAGVVAFGPALEKFAFPVGPAQYDYQRAFGQKSEAPKWSITPPLQNHTPAESEAYKAMFSFSGIGSSVKRFMKENPGMDNVERQLLARETMRVAFEHLASRITSALNKPGISDLKTVVLSGGVASNMYLKHIIRTRLNSSRCVNSEGNLHEKVDMVFPPIELCTDNAAMIAWAGMEMWQAGYRTSLDILPLKKWSIDPKARDCGILGADGWTRATSDELAPVTKSTPTN